MQLRIAVAALALVIGCGRLGFAEQELGRADSGPTMDSTPGDGAQVGDTGPVPKLDGGSDAGAPLPAVGPVRVLSGNHFAYRAAIVWNGSGYGIAYRSPATADIWFLQLGAGGELKSDPISLSEGMSGTLPDVAFAEQEYGVAWKFAGAARFRSVKDDGESLGPIYESTAIGINIDIPIRVAANGREYALVFGTEIINIRSLISARVALDGTGVEAPGLSMWIGSDTPRSVGASWLTVVRPQGTGELWVRGFSDVWTTGTRLDNSPLGGSSERLVRSPDGFTALWIDNNDAERFLMLRQLDPDGTPLGEPVLVLIRASSTSLVASKLTDRGLEVWLQHSTGHDRYVLSRAGTVLVGPDANSLPPNLAFDRSGPDFAFVYTDTEGLWFQREPAL